LEILDDKNLPKFKKNALERAKEFDINNVLPLYQSFYEEIVKKKKAETI